MIFNKLPWCLVFGVLALILSPVAVHALPGDLNGSGRVDGYDLIAFSRAFGSNNGDPKWNSDADLDQNDRVDQADLDILSVHFGKGGVSFGLWVGDVQTGTERVSKISHSGNLLARVGSFGFPRAISSNFLDGTVWVADSNADKVVKLAVLDGASLITVNGMDAYSVSVNPHDGSLWVADYENDRIVQLAESVSDGYSLDTNSGAHKVVTGFNRPRSVAVNPETGVVWVADSFNHRVVRLSAGIDDGYDVDSDTGSHTVITGFQNPYEVAVNLSDGSVWVVDYGNQALVRLSPSGLTEIVRVGGFDPFFGPAVNYMDGSVWIADTNHNRVVKLSAAGVVLAEIAGVNRPYSVSVNPLNGHCRVTEYDSHHVVEFSPNGTEVSRISGFTNPVSICLTPEEIVGATYPMADSWLSSSQAEVGESVTFFGTGTDPDGDIVRYEWDFDGDGTFDYNSADTGNTTHTFDQKGIYNPVFRVTDDQHLSAADYSRVLRVGHLEAVAGADTTSGSTPLTVHFSATYSDPEDGRVDSFQWDFDGDAIFDFYSESSASTNHTYHQGGTFAATLKITDGPHTATDSINIDVTSSGPDASASGDPLAGAAPLRVDFSASATDPDGDIVLYEWDFDGDGSYDWHSTAGANTSHVYMDNLPVTARFRATDNDGLTDAVDISIDVGRAPPVAVAAADPLKAYPLEAFQLDASASHDPGAGGIVLYEWDFDGDGVFDWSSAATGNTTHAYASGGHYAAALRVTDTDSSQATDSVDITVLSPDAPFAVAAADPVSGTTPLTVDFTGAGTDPQGDISEFHWNFGEEYVWVADTLNHQAVRLEQYGNGELVRAGGFDEPQAIAVNPSDGTVWIGDIQNNQVVRLTADGRRELARISGFANPVSISVDSINGHVWVTDVWEVVKLAADGTELVRIDGFYYPWSLSANPTDGSVWVAATFQHEVVKLAADGTELVRKNGFALPESVSTNPADGSVWVADTNNSQVVRLAADGTEQARVGGFNFPPSVSANVSDGSVWVADRQHHQAVKLAADGTELARIDGFNGPAFVSANSTDGSVWVADSGNHQVVKLAPDGTELARLDGFNQPGAVCVADTGAQNHYTSDVTGGTAHTYAFPGIFAARFTVTDDEGNADSQNVSIRVYAAPTVTADSDISSGKIPLTVFFSGTAFDLDGTIVTYEWDFDGDSTYDWRSETSANTRHRYDTAGIYNAVMRATDNDGYSTVSPAVAVTASQGLLEAQAYAGPVAGNAALEVNFSGSGTDPDAAIITYEWDFDGDGSYDFSSSTAADTTHTYNSAGTFGAVLRMTDSTGNTDTDVVDIRVHPAGTPLAVLDAAPVEGTHPLEVCLRGAGSDPDGTITSYEWDFDGDGTFDLTGADPPTAFGDTMERGAQNWTAESPWARIFTDYHSRTFSWTDSPGGDYDDNTDVSLTTGTIDLSAAVDPKLVFYHHYAFISGDSGRVEISGDDGATWSELGAYSDGTLTGWARAEYSLAAYVGSATVKVRFRVTSDASDAADGWTVDDVWVGDCVPHTYAAPGVYPAVLRVTDNDGLENTASTTIAVAARATAGFVWVADHLNHQVVKISDKGTELARITGFNKPRDVAVNPASGHVWITDQANNRVVRLSENTPGGYDTSVRKIAGDATPNDNPAMLFGDATSGTGQLNGCLSLDGNGDYGELPDGFFDFSSGFTVELWAYPTAVGAGQPFIDFGNGQGNDNIVLSRSGASGDLSFSVYSGSTGSGIDASNALELNVWQHLAATVDVAGNAKIYKNGSLIQSGTIPVPRTITRVDNYIGKSNWPNDEYVGLIDDVRIWNIAREAAQIDANKDAELTGAEENLVGYWKMNAVVDTPFHQSVPGFNAPRELAVDTSDGSVWVADRVNHRVVKLTAEGAETYRLSGFNLPWGVSVDQNDGSVWVTDRHNHTVVKLASDGAELVRATGFDLPMGIAVDQSDGSVRVTDTNHNQVVKLAPDGAELYRLGGFDIPRSIAVKSDDGMVWVADDDNHQVVKLAPGPAEVVRQGGFDRPFDVAVHPQNGTAWVTVLNHDQVVKLAPDGTELLRINGFNDPVAVAVDPALRNQSQPPEATAGANPNSGNAPLAVSFTGTATDNGSIIRYQWDFDGDGVYDFESPSTGNASHTYPSPGIYSPVLRVTDDDGMTDYDGSLTIYAGPATVAAVAAPAAGDVPLDVSLNGSVRGFAPDSITLYEWDFNGDGVFDWSHADNPATTRRYSNGGTYTAVLRVTDDQANMAYGTVEVVANHLVPNAVNWSSPGSGTAPLTVTLTGFGTDGDGSIVRFEWDYDGDGLYDWFSDAAAETSFTYAAPGIYDLTLRVTDNDGLTATSTTPITVTERQFAPTAHAAADTTKGNAPLSVNFTGTGTDPDENTITLYEWDFEADGAFDVSSADSGDTIHTYDTPGQYKAILRVTDLDGLTATDNVSIHVRPAGAPVAVANATPGNGDTPLTVDFNADGSHDADGNIVLYEWTLGEEIVWTNDLSANILRRQEGFRKNKPLYGFGQPFRLAVNQADGSVWISDRGAHQVIKLSADGQLELATAVGFSEPEGLTLNPVDGTVWVADKGNHQVVKLAADGRAELARVDGFNAPISVAVHPVDGSAWVADTGNNQVVKLSADGEESTRVSGFSQPAWVAVDPADGAVWVADRYNHRIVKLAADTPDGYHTAMGKIALDLTANNRTGWLFGDAGFQNGRIGGALSLDGDGDYGALDNMVYGTAGQIDAITIEAWVKTDSAEQAIVLSWDRSDYFRLAVGNDQGQPQQRVFWATMGQDGSSDDLVGNLVVADGDWHFISATYEAGTGAKRIYVDGQLDVETTAHGGLNLGSGNVRHGFIGVGSEADSFNGTQGPAHYFSGLLDEVRIWDAARTQAQIQGNMNSELTGSEADLYAYWPMESTGDTPFHRALDGFSHPLCVAVDPDDGTAWVCDYSANQMAKIAPDASHEILRVGGFAAPHEAFVNPLDSSVWVVNYESFWLDKLSPSGVRMRRVQMGDSIYIRQSTIAAYNASGHFSSPTDGTTSHTYTRTGEFPATLKVTDNDGLTDTDTVIVKAGLFPQAMPVAYPTSGEPPLTVTFSNNAISPSGTIESFDWDFDGNGTVDWASAISEYRQHIYSNPGTYTATLKVVDNRQLSGTGSVVITVAVPDADPTALALADPDEGNNPLTVNFTGLGNDTDGTIVRYEWDFDGDSVFDADSTTSGTATHTYGTDGIYNAILRVTDNNGNNGTDSVRIEVKPAGSPTATVNTSATGSGSLTVDFIAGATDADGSIVLFEWDFDGDGTYDWASDTTGNTAHTYPVPGVHTAVLRVTDNDGLTDTHAVEVTVSPVLTVSLNSDLFDPGSGQTMGINSVLTAEATVTVLLKDRTGNTVRTLVDHLVRSAGHYTDAWNGRDDSGSIVPSGVYLYVIEYTVAGKTYTHDLTDSADPTRWVATELAYPGSFNPFNHETNFFRYSIHAKAEVTAYISYYGAYNDIRVKTVFLRKPQTEGRYVYVWDGTDDEGNLVEPFNYLIGVFYYLLPNNAVIVNLEPVLSDLIVSPAYYSPLPNPYGPHAPATFSYTLSKTADVTATIFNSKNHIVRTITVNDVPPGTNTMTWDGKNEQGIYAHSGTHRLKLIATDAGGNRSQGANGSFVVFY